MPMRCSTRGRIAAIRFKVNLPNYGVFDEKRVFAAGTVAGPGKLSRRAARAADLRGYLDRLGRLRERGRVPGRNRRRDSAGAERLALLARQDRCPAQRRGRARHRSRPAAHLHQPVRRPGRTGLRRRIVCAQCRPLDRISASGVRRDGRDHALVARRRHVALHAGTDRGAGRGRQGRLRRLHDRPARLCRKERLQGRRARPVRRHRFGAVRGAGHRCARRRPRALRDAAVPLHGAGIARRRRRDRARARRALRRRADRERRARPRAGARRRIRRLCRATSPRRICRRAPAAPS